MPANGAPEEIRTPDPQIRSLVLYPAELRARFSLSISGRKAHRCRMHSKTFSEVTKARHSYRLRPGLARSANGPPPLLSGPQIPPKRLLNNLKPAGSGPCPLVAHAHQFHRPVRDRDPKGRADGARHQMNVAAMGADQFGGDRKAEPAAAGPAR
jgi:hypothetical protein